MKSVLGILCFALLMSPLAADACPHSKSKAKMAKHSQSVYPVVVHLESRDQKITVSSGANGPVYRIETTDGDVVADGISDADLQANHPETYRYVKTATGQGDAVLDASVTPELTVIF